MKRNMDLIRILLFQIERESNGLDLVPVGVEDYPEQEVQFHLMLLDEAGLIKTYDMSGGDSLMFMPVRLTWQGYEFLDAARDDTRWNKAKETMNKAGGFVFEVAKALLIDYLKRQVLPGTP
jgi:hypothetical protein